jgi:hypothetical protein
MKPGEIDRTTKHERIPLLERCVSYRGMALEPCLSGCFPNARDSECLQNRTKNDVIRLTPNDSALD